MKKHILLAVLLVFCFAKTFAQTKLKDVQENGLWAPSVIKIDGNLTELNDSFQAYNKRTKLFYTISNDEKYIYLQVKSTDATNNAKIQAGGITFTLNTADKKKEDDAFVVTYPVINRPARAQRGGQRGGGAGFGGGGRNAPTDSAAIDAAHKQFIAASKEIKVAGFKDITDTLISIYNEYSIKAAIGYNGGGGFTYELALPLKELGLTPDAAKEMAYNVKLNGLQMAMRGPDANAGGGGGFGGGGFGGGGGRGGAGGGGRGNTTRVGVGGGSRNNINFEEIAAPTDFWGKYTLAKNK